MDEAINNLFECGKRLSLRNQVISSAAIYYHKFVKKSNQLFNVSIDHNLIACTCLYLASKVEESPIKCKELLCQFNECINKTDELSFNKFDKLTKSVMFCEMLICQSIDFDLNNDLPHKYLLHYLKSLNEWLFDDQNRSVQFSNLAWSLLIDFYKSPDSTSITDEQLKPQEIAVGILQIAIRVFRDNLDQELDRLLNYTYKLYDNLDNDNLWKINFIVMDLRSLGADFYKIARGGLITFQGYGKLTVYPILYLGSLKTQKSIKKYVSMLEDVVVNAGRTILRDVDNVFVSTVSEYPGVWINNDRKLAAIGIGCKRFVTMHGVSINRNINLDWFEHIVPCGIENKSVTSFSQELGQNFTVKDATPYFLNSFKNTFKCETIDVLG